LIDARHGVKENDKMLWEMLEEYKRFYVIAMTKADGISDAALKDRFLEIADATRNNGHCSKIIFATSAK
jgi:GTP-binding protein EngB required for normal cell division